MRIGILLSGGGSTYGNLAAAIAAGDCPGTICGVVSSRRDAGGLDRATGNGHPCAVAREPAAVAAALADFGAELVAMCGWMRYWDPPDPWRGRTVNIHPSLLPAFGGRGMYARRVHAAVLAAGCTLSGCTAHLVAGDYDTGPILAQRAVRVYPDDDAATLEARVQAAERWLYPRVIAALVDGRVQTRDGRHCIGDLPPWETS